MAQRQQSVDDSGWDYASLLPLAQRRVPYANALQPRLAVPGALRDVASSLGQMLTVPGQALRGELGQAPEQLMQPALRVTEGLMAAGAGAPVPSGSMRVFGGLKSKALDRTAMTKARELEAKGTPAPDVWSQTGMFRGPDNKWRHEISDEGASWKGAARGLGGQQPGMAASAGSSQPFGGMRTVELEGEHKLGDILDHPKLYEAYPHLKGLTVGKETGGNLGSYGDGQIGLGGGQDRQAALRTVMHEVQHAVQDHEGHAFGGTPQEFMPLDLRTQHSISGMQMLGMQEEARAKGGAPLFIESALTKQQNGAPLMKQEQKAAEWLEQNPDIATRYQQAMDNHNQLSQQFNKAWENAHQQYQALGGETESRNVEQRLLTGDWKSFPGDTQDVPFQEQRVRFPAGGSFGESASHKLEPVEHDPFSQTAAGHQLQPVEHDPFGETPMLANPTPAATPSRLNMELNSGLTRQQDMQTLDSQAIAGLQRQFDDRRAAGMTPRAQATETPLLADPTPSSSPSKLNLLLNSGATHELDLESLDSTAIKRLEDALQARRQAGQTPRPQGGATVTDQQWLEQGGT